MKIYKISNNAKIFYNLFKINLDIRIIKKNIMNK